MDGDLKGDFTRDTFDKTKHFSRVLMQQGRVQLDADWNEQVDILLHYMRTLVTDLVGPYWGPAAPSDGKDGFNVTVVVGESSKILIQEGRYYVDGILCENDGDKYTVDPKSIIVPGGIEDSSQLTYIIYLDVWESQVTSIEDDSIRELALGGPDTASRAKVEWRVRSIRVKDKSNDENYHDYALTEKWPGWVKKLSLESRGSLEVRCIEDTTQTATPQFTTQSKYRGIENQLYRIEIHKGGKLSDNPTFKWSRENGAAVFPIVELAGKVVTVKHIERGGRFGLEPNDWVEIVDDDSVSKDSPTKLMQVDKVDYVRMQVTLMDIPGAGHDQKKHPYLRRWDHQAGDSGQQNLEDGVVLIPKDSWLSLENGIQIRFLSTDSPTYRSGDYWLIPARTATGDVQWPQPGNSGPRGVEHHFAPLAIIKLEKEGVITKANITNLRTLIKTDGKETLKWSGISVKEEGGATADQETKTSARTPSKKKPPTGSSEATEPEPPSQ